MIREHLVNVFFLNRLVFLTAIISSADEDIKEGEMSCFSSSLVNTVSLKKMLFVACIFSNCFFFYYDKDFLYISDPCYLHTGFNLVKYIKIIIPRIMDINLCLTTYFQYDGQIYQQMRGNGITTVRTHSTDHNATSRNYSPPIYATRAMDLVLPQTPGTFYAD